MSRNAYNNKIGKIRKYRRQFDDFDNFWQIWRLWRNFVKLPNVCKSVPYMIASHVGESAKYGYFGQFGDFGEFLSNRQM